MCSLDDRPVINIFMHTHSSSSSCVTYTLYVFTGSRGVLAPGTMSPSMLKVICDESVAEFAAVIGTHGGRGVVSSCDMCTRLWLLRVPASFGSDFKAMINEW